jgi:hypothetical protein
MMTLKRFRLLSESYGADLLRWPAEARDEAQALLSASAEARALFEEARRLDAAIGAASAHEQAQRWPLDERNQALTRLRSRVALQIAAEAVRPPVRRLGWLLRGQHPTASPRLRRWGLATSGVFAIVLGLLVGTLYAPAPAPVAVLTALLRPAALEILPE